MPPTGKPQRARWRSSTAAAPPPTRGRWPGSTLIAKFLIGAWLARHQLGEVEPLARRLCAQSGARQRAPGVIDAISQSRHVSGALGQPKPAPAPFDPDQAIHQHLLGRAIRCVLGVKALLQLYERGFRLPREQRPCPAEGAEIRRHHQNLGARRRLSPPSFVIHPVSSSMAMSSRGARFCRPCVRKCAATCPWAAAAMG
jgi:hypothetical protein